MKYPLHIKITCAPATASIVKMKHVPECLFIHFSSTLWFYRLKVLDDYYPPTVSATVLLEWENKNICLRRRNHLGINEDVNTLIISDVTVYLEE